TVQVFGDPTVLERVQAYLGLGRGKVAKGRHDGVTSDQFGDSLGRIIEDLEDRRGTKEGDLKRIRIEAPLMRAWVKVPDMRDAQLVDGIPVFNRPCRLRSDMVVLDILNPSLSTAIGASTLTPRNSPTHGGTTLGQDTEVGVSRWNMQCSDIGLSLSRPSDGGRYRKEKGDSFVKPVLKISSRHVNSSPAQNANLTPSLPNIELTVRPKTTLPYDHLGFSIHATPSGLKLNRPTGGDHEFGGANAGAFGLKSWYDVGTSGRGKDRGEGEDGDDDLLWFKQRTVGQSVLFLNCTFPACDMVISKPDFDLLQILLNDLAIWQPSVPRASAAPQVADSFGPEASFTSFHMARSTLTASESRYGETDADSESGDEKNNGGFQARHPLSFDGSKDSGRCFGEMTGFCAAVSLGSEPALDATSSSGNDYHVYAVSLEDVRIFDATGHAGKPVSYIWIDSEDISFSDETLLEARMEFVYRTLPRTAKSKPMLSSSFMLSFDKEVNMKETTASLTLSGMTVRTPNAGDLLQDLAAFGKEPEGMTYIDVASRFTKLYVNLAEVCVDYRPLYLSTRAVLGLDGLTISTSLIPDSPTLGLKVMLYNANLFLLEDVARIAALDAAGDVGEMVGRAVEAANLGGYTNVGKFWTALGFASVASVDALELNMRTSGGDVFPSFELETTNNQMYIDTCADSFASLQKILAYIGGSGDRAGTDGTAESPASIPDDIGPQASSPINQDVLCKRQLQFSAFLGQASHLFIISLAKLDEDAFKLRSDTVAPPNHVSASPASLVFEDDFYGEGGADNLGRSVLIDAEMQPPSYRAAKVYTGTGAKGGQDDIVRVFHDPKTFAILEDYFTGTLASGGAGAGGSQGSAEKAGLKETYTSVMRIRVRDFDLTWRIFDGYDWEQTRKYVFEQKIKAKRSRRAGKHAAADPAYHRQPQAPTKVQSKRSSLGSTAGGIPTSSPPSNPFDNGISGMGYIGRDFEDVGVDAETYSAQATSPPHDVDDWDHDRDFDTASDGSDYSGFSGRSRQTSATHPVSPSVIARAAPKSADDLVRSAEGRVEFRAFKVNFEFDVYPKSSQRASRLTVSVRDFEIIDNVKTSLWRKFLSHLRPDSGNAPRETESDMVRIELVNVRPDVKDVDNQELRLKVRLLPLRMYVDQDALTCLLRFFSFEAEGKETTIGSSKPDNTFIQYAEFDTIALKVDYKPKHVDFANLKGGNLVEIMNFFHLDGAEMSLRKAKLTGITGWGRLFNELFKQWLPHIKNTQVPRVVSGVSGVRSLVNVGSGVADLILLPIEQYKKDGRVVRGLQKGAKSFAKAATLETIKLGTRLAVGTQVMLEHADDILSSDQANEYADGWEVDETGSIVPSTVHSGGSGSGRSSMDQVSKFSEQPKDLKEGIGLAYGSLRRNVGTAAKTILAVPMEVYEKTGTQGTVRAVIRAMPVAVLKPMIGATEAVSKTLMGIQNTIDPNKRLQMEDKYKA
ncbi:autophagy- protein 2, partial [Rhizophlyctis rosea]